MPKRLTFLPVAFIFMVCAAAALPAQEEASAAAQSAKTTAPTASEAAPYKKVRQDEDWSYLRDDPARKIDYLDKLKYIPLRNEDGWYVSLGGDVRERYELLDRLLWGQGQTDKEVDIESRGWLFLAPEHS
jgi:hypothetical protein